MYRSVGQSIDWFVSGYSVCVTRSATRRPRTVQEWTDPLCCQIQHTRPIIIIIIMACVDWSYTYGHKSVHSSPVCMYELNELLRTTHSAVVVAVLVVVAILAVRFPWRDIFWIANKRIPYWWKYSVSVWPRSFSCTCQSDRVGVVVVAWYYYYCYY